MKTLPLLLEFGTDFGSMAWPIANMKVAGMQSEGSQKDPFVWRFPSVAELKVAATAKLLRDDAWYWTDEGAWLTEATLVDQIKAVSVAKCEEARIDVNSRDVSLMVVRFVGPPRPKPGKKKTRK